MNMIDFKQFDSDEDNVDTSSDNETDTENESESDTEVPLNDNQDLLERRPRWQSPRIKCLS